MLHDPLTVPGVATGIQGGTGGQRRDRMKGEKRKRQGQTLSEHSGLLPNGDGQRSKKPRKEHRGPGGA